MRWWALPLGAGGCLLGWEPEDPGSDRAETDTDTDADADADCEPPAGASCAAFDERVVSVEGSLVPVISSDLGMSDLYVYRGVDLLWHAWSDDYRNSVYAFTYGETPPGTSEGGEAVPLVPGAEYELKIDAVCVDDRCEDRVSSVYRSFTAGD